MAAPRLLNPPPPIHWPPSQTIKLTPSQSKRLRELMRRVPWNRAELALHASQTKPVGKALNAYGDWDGQLGLRFQDLRARLEGRWGDGQHKKVPSDKHLSKQLDGKGKTAIPTPLLAMICGELGTTIGELLGQTRSRPFYLDDFIAALEMAHQIGPNDTRKLILALEPFLILWRRNLRLGEKEGRKSLAALRALTETALAKYSVDQKSATPSATGSLVDTP